MRDRLSPARALALLLVAAPAAAQQSSAAANAAHAAAASPGAARWWEHVTVLAHDSMYGRRTGSEDYVKAARYVAQQLAAAGLEPGGTDGFFQSVHLVNATLAIDRSGVVLVKGGTSDTLRLGTDATIAASPSLAPSVSGPMVFVGYGLHLPGYYDDLAKVDVHGKVAVYLNRMPTGLNATMFAHGRSSRAAELHRLGAVAELAIADPPAAGRGVAPGGGGGGGRGRGVLGLADDPTAGGMLITVQASAAERLLSGSGHTVAELRALDSAQKPLPGFALAASLRAWSALERVPMDAPNVVGILRGSDARLRNEYLVISAHLDHIGISRPVNGDSINNGAMDNASGSATLMETARAFHDQHVRPRRSIIFLAVTGEEEGELGSAYFALHPTVPVAQIIADLNTDMWLPIIPFKGVFAYGWDESDLGKDLEPVLKRRGLVNYVDPEPEQVRFIRSDQYSFIKRGIPAMAFKTGYAPGSPEMTVAVDWRNARYHKVSDDLDQPIDFQCVTEFDAMYFELVRAVADRETRPAWNPGSVFGLIPRAK